jgi:hypothetical protein
MKIVAFESILATPHTETLLELCVLHSLAGDEVIYVPASRVRQFEGQVIDLYGAQFKTLHYRLA